MRRRQTGVRGVVTFALVLGAILVPATPSAAAEVFSDGFESGNLSLWTSTINFTAQSAIVRTGGFAGRATTATNDANASKTLASTQTNFYLRAFVNVVSHTGSTPLLRVRTATGAVIMTVNVNATNKLSTNNTVTGVNRQSTTTVTLGTFHEIQLHTHINGASGTVEVWYDGALVSSLSSAPENLGTAPVGRFVLGRTGTSSSPMDIVYDDVVASTTFIGGGGGTPPGTPTNLRTTSPPVSNRVNLAWDVSTGATSYTLRRTGGAPFTPVSTPNTSFSDTAVAANTSYQYTIDACNTAGCSPQSAALPVQTPPASGGGTVVMAAGDIACDPTDANFNNGNGTASKCRQKFTGQLLGGANHVLPIGDTQYECAGLAAYNQSYNLTGWGAAKSISHPILSDEDYDTVGTDCGAAGPDGYTAYFGAQAPGDYYKVDDAASGWRFIALNSECSKVPGGGCAEGSAQNNFLEQNLVANQCTIAMLHKPYFRSKANGAQVTTAMLPFWQDLTAFDAEIVLGGDSHFYERFNPMDVNGNFQAGGTVQFVVGVGGKSRGGLAAVSARHPQHAKGTAATFGVLKLTLHPGSYDWQFVVEGSNSFTDTGSATC